MSRKPTIKISYPEASEKALQLTEAMVKRAPGKRVVETESDDPVFPGAGDLFSSFIRCKTQTGVELTLNLNPSSMDYALETLIRPNLTADERRRILGEDAEQTELALTPGEQLANELIIEPEKKIEIGKIPDRDLRTILADLVDATQGYVQGEKHIENAIETAIKEIDHRAGVIDLNETQNEQGNTSGEKPKKAKKSRKKKQDPSWDDVEAEARQMQASALKQSAAPLADNGGGEIDSGLLNDLDDRSDGMAPAEEVIGHDE